MMFPRIKTDIEQLLEKTEVQKSNKIGKTYQFDYQKKAHMIIDGKFVECTSIEAIEQWVEKVLRTEKNKYKIYTEDEIEEFGISISQYIGMRNLPEGFIVSELEREITEQLKAHSMIEEIKDFKSNREKRGFLVSFKIELTNKTILEKEVILDGL